jgi:hypothetical protein
MVSSCGLGNAASSPLLRSVGVSSGRRTRVVRILTSTPIATPTGTCSRACGTARPLADAPPALAVLTPANGHGQGLVGLGDVPLFCTHRYHLLYILFLAVRAAAPPNERKGCPNCGVPIQTRGLMRLRLSSRLCTRLTTAHPPETIGGSQTLGLSAAASPTALQLTTSSPPSKRPPEAQRPPTSKRLAVYLKPPWRATSVPSDPYIISTTNTAGFTYLSTSSMRA